MTKPLPDPGRRRLLARARDTAAAGAAVALLPTAVPAATTAAPAVEPPPAEPAHRGYRESERARRYYDLARY